MPHEIDLRVRFYELDAYGHVNHSVYVQYFEVGRVEALAEARMGLDTLQADMGINMVVVQICTRFLGSAVLGDDLVVESGLSAVGRVKATWAQRIRRGSEVLATQEMTSACITAAGKPTRFPPELVKALEPYRVEPGWLGNTAPKKLG
ncbi:MAG: acyl-CoA thioesterase [Acidimicrobiales bacterium]